MLTYRPATERDFDFLWNLHRNELRPHILAAYPVDPWRWDDDGQRRVLRALYSPPCTRVILVAGQPAGALQVTREHNRLVLDYIALAAPYQGRGLGTCVLQHLQDRARHLNLPIELQVGRTNPALRLYRRLGFEITRTTTLLYWLRWEPQGWRQKENSLEVVGYPAG
jgi:ribosomal protein S18 acetylase RimI-like enzyme